MLQEISQALCISFEDVCKLQQDNLDLFYWFEKKLEDVEKECEEKMESAEIENTRFSNVNCVMADTICNLEYDLVQYRREVKSLQELLEENGIDYTEAE